MKKGGNRGVCGGTIQCISHYWGGSSETRIFYCSNTIQFLLLQYNFCVGWESKYPVTGFTKDIWSGLNGGRWYIFQVLLINAIFHDWLMSFLQLIFFTFRFLFSSHIWQENEIFISGHQGAASTLIFRIGGHIWTCKMLKSSSTFKGKKNNPQFPQLNQKIKYFLDRERFCLGSDPSLLLTPFMVLSNAVSKWKHSIFGVRIRTSSWAFLFFPS